MHQVYDVAHNTAKLERAPRATARSTRLLVHRKGATRAFGAGDGRGPGPLPGGRASR